MPEEGLEEIMYLKMMQQMMKPRRNWAAIIILLLIVSLAGTYVVCQSPDFGSGSFCTMFNNIVNQANPFAEKMTIVIGVTGHASWPGPDARISFASACLKDEACPTVVSSSGKCPNNYKLETTVTKPDGSQQVLVNEFTIQQPADPNLGCVLSGAGSGGAKNVVVATEGTYTFNVKLYWKNIFGWWSEQDSRYFTKHVGG